MARKNFRKKLLDIQKAQKKLDAQSEETQRMVRKATEHNKMAETDAKKTISKILKESKGNVDQLKTNLMNRKELIKESPSTVMRSRYWVTRRGKELELVTRLDALLDIKPSSVRNMKLKKFIQEINRK